MAALVSSGDVATELGVSRRTVIRMVARGSLPGVRVEGQWRFRPDVVAAYQAEHTTEAKAARAEAALIASQTRPAPAAFPIDGTYIPVVKGAVPWREEVIREAARPAATHRAVDNKRTASVRS